MSETNWKDSYYWQYHTKLINMIEKIKPEIEQKLTTETNKEEIVKLEQQMHI